MKRFKKMYNHKNGNQMISRLIPYETIEAAIVGDETAIDEIVRHYGGYIQRLAGKESYASNKRSCYVVDKTKADIIKTALIERIPEFNLLC